MLIPGVHIETVHHPIRYTHQQIEKATLVAAFMNRGKLVLAEDPAGPYAPPEDPHA